MFPRPMSAILAGGRSGGITSGMMFPGGLRSSGLQRSDRHAVEGVGVGLQQDGPKANARVTHATDFHRLKHDPRVLWRSLLLQTFVATARDPIIFRLME